jgi:hypothetical protein
VTRPRPERRSDRARNAAADSSSAAPPRVATVSGSPNIATPSAAALIGSISMITEAVAARTTAAPAKYSG